MQISRSRTRILHRGTQRETTFLRYRLLPALYRMKNSATSVKNTNIPTSFRNLEKLGTQMRTVRTHQAIFCGHHKKPNNSIEPLHQSHRSRAIQFDLLVQTVQHRTRQRRVDSSETITALLPIICCQDLPRLTKMPPSCVSSLKKRSNKCPPRIQPVQSTWDGARHYRLLHWECC